MWRRTVSAAAAAGLRYARPRLAFRDVSRPTPTPRSTWPLAAAAVGAVGLFAVSGSLAYAHAEHGSGRWSPPPDADADSDDSQRAHDMCTLIAQSRTADAQALLRAHPQLAAAATRQGWTALHVAVVRGDVPMARALLLSGADPNAADKFNGSAATLETALAHVDARLAHFGYRGTMPQFTPLHYACMYDRWDMLETLLSFGADPQVKASGVGALELVADQDRQRVAAVVAAGRKRFLERAAEEEKKRRRECTRR